MVVQRLDNVHGTSNHRANNNLPRSVNCLMLRIVPSSPPFAILTFCSSTKHDLARPCASEIAPPEWSVADARGLSDTACEAKARDVFLDEEEEDFENALTGDKVTCMLQMSLEEVRTPCHARATLRLYRACKEHYH